MASSISEVVGSTGLKYYLKALLQERPKLGRVWLATSDKGKHILKDIPEEMFTHFEKTIRPQIRPSQYVRLPCDSIPQQRIFVYDYLKEGFLDLVKKEPPTRTRKQILKAILHGIAALHDQHVVHLDIKPDNVMIDYDQAEGSFSVSKIQLIDLENAAFLPPGRCIQGMLAGNDNWRSPEAHFRAELNKPTDLFSFGAICIYAILDRVIFGPDDDFHYHVAQGALPSMIRLQRQVSYFGDQDGVDGLLKHMGKEQMSCRILGVLWDGRSEEVIPYRPFAEWPDIDGTFRDMILRLMNLDPAKRISARQALDHPWFTKPDLDP